MNTYRIKLGGGEFGGNILSFLSGVAFKASCFGNIDKFEVFFCDGRSIMFRCNSDAIVNGLKVYLSNFNLTIEKLLG